MGVSGQGKAQRASRLFVRSELVSRWQAGGLASGGEPSKQSPHNIS